MWAKVSSFKCFRERDRKFVSYVQRDRGENRMTLSEESVQGLPQTVIGDFFRRNVPYNVGPAFRRPASDVNQRNGAVEPSSNQQAQHRAVIIICPRIRRQMSVDDTGHVHPFKQWPHHGQGAEVAAVRRRLVSVPRERHPIRMRKMDG